MGLSDRLKTLVIYPFVFVRGCLRSTVGGLLAVPYIIYRYPSFGKLKRLKFHEVFEACKAVYFGRDFFSFCTGVTAPYTASITPFVEDLNSTQAVISIEDRPWLRNPFGCLHAACLANLTEAAIGVAAVTAMERAGPHVRGVVVDLKVDYVKKARGTVTAYAPVMQIPAEVGKHKVMGTAEIRDQAGDVTTRATCTWYFDVREQRPKQE
eukprot:comp26794_c0_seq1/m.47120 comp26794_c0_seq1/g.47120  ORF comp26794_c0_seq1/g.47120 comp26794_c0_seq1/m.47120 type:complete len:209 (-) comp26794_c0_seq1:512-1138(-)